MIKIERLVNQLMTSNCYIVVNAETNRCIVIDPGSEKSEREIQYIIENRLKLDYVLVTHEHSDHNWGVNALMDAFKEAKLVCSDECSKRVNKMYKAYFLLYYDDPNYHYDMHAPDIVIKSDDDYLDWEGIDIRFIHTPGHSYGSMCISIDNMLFTGDTIMPSKPYFNGRDSNKDDWNCSIMKIRHFVTDDTLVYPGHGEILELKDWYDNYVNKSFYI